MVDTAIVWEGFSALDPTAPLVAIITGMSGRSKNPKTGPMAQLWIIRSDRSPLDAIADGSDSAICGKCIFRGYKGKGRGCYVTVKNAPLAIYRKYARGGYQTMAPEYAALTLRDNGVALRLGAYGDPAALPAWLLQRLTDVIVSHTGYTHSWRNRPDLARYVMASADCPGDYALAHSMGFRTFRTRTSDQPMLTGEIACPASDEAGKRTTCEKCKLCNGADSNDKRKSIAIIVHGAVASIHALRVIRNAAELKVA